MGLLVPSLRPAHNVVPKIVIKTADFLAEEVVRNRPSGGPLCLDFDIGFQNQSQTIREEGITDNYRLEIEPSLQGPLSPSIGERKDSSLVSTARATIHQNTLLHLDRVASISCSVVRPTHSGMEIPTRPPLSQSSQSSSSAKQVGHSIQM